MSHKALIMAVILLARGALWDVQFTPHALNKTVQVVTRCSSGTPFFALSTYEVTPTQRTLQAIRHRVPDAESKDCWVGVEVLRNDGDDPTQDYIGEWGLVRLSGDLQ